MYYSVQAMYERLVGVARVHAYLLYLIILKPGEKKRKVCVASQSSLANWWLVLSPSSLAFYFPIHDRLYEHTDEDEEGILDTRVYDKQLQYLGVICPPLWCRPKHFFFPDLTPGIKSILRSFSGALYRTKTIQNLLEG